MSKTEKLKVLIVASEITPYAKSGGLGDVIGSLPKALAGLDVDVRVVFPKYKTIKENLIQNITFIHSFVIRLNWRNQSTAIYKTDGEIPTYLIENDYYFGRDAFYGFWDDDERFAFFTKASVEFLNYIDFTPDIIHFNDWQTGLGSLYLKENYGGFVFYKDIKTVYTIHNIQYQGNFSRGALNRVDLDDSYFTPSKIEFYDRISFMKAGITYADAVTTVSSSYAEEIKTSEYGYGMDPILRANSYKLLGIVNGIDTDLNDPKTDKRIYKNFDINSLENKNICKRELQKELNLPQIDVPIIAIISRLVDQKGLDLVAIALNEIMSMDVQLVVLGTGEGYYEHLFKTAAHNHPDKLSASIFFDDTLAQKIYASSDMFLMPSYFEPCGLGQIFAMRYGTIPIVRKTGGLADTVEHFNAETGTGNGFVFNDYLANAMMWGVRLAVSTYYEQPENWEILVKNALNSDFSWKSSAQKYVDLYKSLKG